MTRSTQCDVTWQTSSECHRLTVPSGRILNYVCFMRKIQNPEIFGPCSYVCAFCPVHWLKIQIEHKNGLLLFYGYFQLEIKKNWFSVIISYCSCLCECLVFDSFKVAPAEWSRVSYWCKVCVMASDFFMWITSHCKFHTLTKLLC